MAAKPLDIHPAALAELKSAVVWYDQRSESAGDGFVAEIDRSIELITASGRTWHQKICPLTISIRSHLLRKTDDDPNSSLRARSPQPRILGRTSLKQGEWAGGLHLHVGIASLL
jgi:hypothetical protein